MQCWDLRDVLSIERGQVKALYYTYCQICCSSNCYIHASSPTHTQRQTREDLNDRSAGSGANCLGSNSVHPDQVHHPGTFLCFDIFIFIFGYWHFPHKMGCWENWMLKVFWITLGPLQVPNKHEFITIVYNYYIHIRASLIAQLVKNSPATETPVQILDWEDPLEKG